MNRNIKRSSLRLYCVSAQYSSLRVVPMSQEDKGIASEVTTEFNI